MKLASLRDDAIRTVLTAFITGVASHPEDDVVLDAAVSAAVGFLVTGDKQLQRLGTFQGVRIVSPGSFLGLLDQPTGDDENEPAL